MSQISQKILKYKTIVELDRPTQVRRQWEVVYLLKYFISKNYL